MKYLGENAVKKLIALFKGDLATKQPTITASGLLKGDGTGTISAADTQEATLVDVPSGLLKGDGTTISAAVAGTDYVEPSALDKKLSLSGGTMTGEIKAGAYVLNKDFSIANKNRSGTGITTGFIGSIDNEGLFDFSNTAGVVLFDFSSESAPILFCTKNKSGGKASVLFDSKVDMDSNLIQNLATPTADTDAATKKYVDDNAATALSTDTITSTWNSITV